MPKALITGIAGQDGSYLAEWLIELGYEVHGIVRKRYANGSIQLHRVSHILDKISLHVSDLCDGDVLTNIIQSIRPDEMYSFAAVSDLAASYKMPEYTKEVNDKGVTMMLEAIRKYAPDCRFYQAGSSEMFGNQPSPQSEESRFEPESPYAIAKVEAYHSVRQYRENFNIYAVNGILFNHESPRRDRRFVTKKIARQSVEVVSGSRDHISLGNINSRRDWGYAPEYCQVMWKTLQQKIPNDFVIATGESYSVKDFCQMAFAELDVEVEWLGSGFLEYGIDKKSGKVIVRTDPSFYRPLDVRNLLGNASKAKEVLGWNRKYNLIDIVREMVLFEKDKKCQTQ